VYPLQLTINNYFIKARVLAVILFNDLSRLLRMYIVRRSVNNQKNKWQKVWNEAETC